MGDITIAKTIKDGDHVIIDINNERQSCLKIKPNGKLKVGKAYVPAASLIGQNYGSLFEITGGPPRLQKRKRISEIASEDWDSIIEIDKNNSRLEDKGMANQSLTSADVELLKAEGKTGDEIVAALTQHSATFQGKTQFSQEKYKRKKTKKYTTHVTVIRPTAQSLAEFYFKKIPVKTGWLRPDSLAILLSLANISAFGRTLVVDGTGGLIAAASLERMGAQGTVVNGYVGDRKAPSEIVSLLNLHDSVRSSHIQISLASLLELHSKVNSKETDAQDPQPDNSTPAKKPKTELKGEEHSSPADEEAQQDGLPGLENNDVEVLPSEDIASGVSTGAQDVSMDAGHESERHQRFARERAEKEAKLKDVCTWGFQSCILGHPTADPLTLIQTVLPLLAPSASLAIFFPTLQPLAECMNELIKTRAAVGLQLQESWHRQYQVLPGRTHPMMSTSGTGGYILSGTKIIQ